MAITRITFDVDTSQFFDAAGKIDRATIGDRFIELCLSPDDWRTRVGLLAAYGVEVINSEPAPAKEPVKDD